MTTPDTDAATHRQVPDLWGHLGLIVTLLAGALVLVRLLAAAEWDGQLAVAILQASGTADVLSGALLSTAPLVLGMVLVLMGCRVPYILVRHRKRPTFWDVWQVVLILAVMTLTTWTAYVICLFVGTVAAVFFGVTDRTAPTAGLNSNKRLAISLLVSPIIGGLLFTSTPWMARESLEFTTGPSKPLVGYILSTNNDQLAVLTDSPRSIRFLPASDLKNRELCGKRQWFASTPLQLIGSMPEDRPECPKTK
jgi:hypothetical protein